MKLPLYALTIFLGVVLTVHLAMNGKVGAAIGNPRVANAIFWCIGAVGAIIIGLTGWNEGVLKPLAHVNPWLFTAALLGTSLVFAIAWLMPIVGAGPVMIGLLAGQVFGGMLLSNYGWLGSPVKPVSLINILGAAVLLGGVFIATYSPGK